MEKTIGFIGCGNMATAMISGIIDAKIVDKSKIFASKRNEEQLNDIHVKYGINVTTDNKKVANKSDILFLSVKPNVYETVINEIKDDVKENVIIVIIAAGKSLEAVEKLFGKKLKMVRTMPNTPALVGEAMTALCSNDMMSDAEMDEIKSIFNSFGKVEVVGENLFDTVTAVSGSSPAYVYMFIEAMADAAVAGGMPRKQAYKFAAQAVLGSAKMVLDTGIHPGELKDMVTSPGGTTIDAVIELEKTGMRNSVMQAVLKCMEKSKLMSK